MGEMMYTRLESIKTEDESHTFVTSPDEFVAFRLCRVDVGTNPTSFCALSNTIIWTHSYVQYAIGESVLCAQCLHRSSIPRAESVVHGARAEQRREWMNHHLCHSSFVARLSSFRTSLQVPHNCAAVCTCRDEVCR